MDSNVEVKDRAGLGGKVDLEDSLGYDDDDYSWLVGGSWRFGDRHRIEVRYFGANRDVDAVALDDIDVGGGETIPAGAGYSSELDVSVLPVSYSYSFIKNDGGEFYGTVGLHWYAIDYDILGAAGLGDEFWDGSVKAEADAPLPLIGAGYDWYVNERWKVTLGGEAFYIKLSDGPFSFEGSLVSLGVSTEYYIWDNFGVGAGVNYFNMDVDVDDDDWNGGFEYEWWGPSAFATLRF